MGKSGASASGPTGSRVPGCSGGGGGEGRSGTMLYHCLGSSDSCRTYLTWWSMGRLRYGRGNADHSTIVAATPAVTPAQQRVPAGRKALTAGQNRNKIGQERAQP